MGKLHWDRHAQKPSPIKSESIGENVMLVVRERAKPRSGNEFVATARYKHPPVPGQFVIKFAYGSTPEHAQLMLLDALIQDARTRTLMATLSPRYVEAPR